MNIAPTSEQFTKGSVIFAKGDPGFVAYIVRKGRVMILKGHSASDAVVAMRGPGEMIGEMALASGAPRSATAVAATDCILMAIHKSEIERRMDDADPILRLIMLTAFERLREYAARTQDAHRQKETSNKGSAPPAQ